MSTGSFKKNPPIFIEGFFDSLPDVKLGYVIVGNNWQKIEYLGYLFLTLRFNSSIGFYRYINVYFRVWAIGRKTVVVPFKIG